MRPGKVLQCSILLPMLGGCLPALSPPDNVVPITIGADSFHLWPYTGSSFDGYAVDPVNLIFVGEASPQNIRSLLLSLDTIRTGPFGTVTCRWSDAVGMPQTGYMADSGWVGSAIQLQCGSYEQFRFHLRLFAGAGRTLGNVHVEFLIPGTPEHQVLNWELAEQFAAYDFVRTGRLVTAPATTGPLNGQPAFSSISTEIFNELPPALVALTGSTQPAVKAVGIPTNGTATILSLLAAPEAAGSTRHAFVVSFNQTIPKPFCRAGSEKVNVVGPLSFSQIVEVSASGGLRTETTIGGALTVAAADQSGIPGERIHATLSDRYTSVVGDEGSSVSIERVHHRLDSKRSWRQSLTESLLIRPANLGRYARIERCGSQP